MINIDHYDIQLIVTPDDRIIYQNIYIESNENQWNNIMATVLYWFGREYKKITFQGWWRRVLLGGFTNWDRICIEKTNYISHYQCFVTSTKIPYFNMFHLAPSPSSLQFNGYLSGESPNNTKYYWTPLVISDWQNHFLWQTPKQLQMKCIVLHGCWRMFWLRGWSIGLDSEGMKWGWLGQLSPGGSN
jgi:hypothetical protein